MLGRWEAEMAAARPDKRRDLEGADDRQRCLSLEGGGGVGAWVRMEEPRRGRWMDDGTAAWRTGTDRGQG